MPGEDYQSWSTTALDNGNSDTLINWLEGQPRASVNNSSRSEMAAHAKNRNLQNGSIVTTGTPNAQAFISGVGYTGTVPTDLRVLLKIGAGLTNTGPATLDMDSIGAVAIKNSGLDLKKEELTEGSYVELRYDGTNWILLYSSIFVQTITNTSIVQIITIPPDATIPSTTIDFSTAIDDTYSEYLFTGLNIIPVTDGAELWMLVSTDAGATWKTGASDYAWCQLVSTALGSVNVGSNADSHIMVTNNLANAPNLGCCFTARVITPSLAFHDTVIELTASMSAAAPFDFALTRWIGSARYNSTTPVNGIRFVLSTGNIASGSVKMTGIK